MIDRILKESIVKWTFDNVTAVVIAFKHFKNSLEGKSQKFNLKISETMTPTHKNLYTPDLRFHKTIEINTWNDLIDRINSATKKRMNAQTPTIVY